jgi:hypothetical protein
MLQDAYQGSATGGRSDAYVKLDSRVRQALRLVKRSSRHSDTLQRTSLELCWDPTKRKTRVSRTLDVTELAFTARLS